MRRETATATKNGLMVQFTKASGKTIKLADSVNFSTQMATYTKATGWKTKLTAMERINMRMVLTTKASGTMTSSMVLGKNIGLMVQSLRGST